jgi:hypothetical protein
MSSGSLIAIGITALICVLGFGKSALNPVGLAKDSTFFYSATVFSLVLAASCFVPVAYRSKRNRNSNKNKTHHRSQSNISSIKQNKDILSSWRYNLANFDLGRLTIVGWLLLLLSFILLCIGVSMTNSSLANAGVKEISSGAIKILSIINIGAVVAFFLTSKWILEKLGIKILKD